MPGPSAVRPMATDAARLAILVLAGAAIGLAAYEASRLTGRLLFSVAGAAIGVLAWSARRFFGKSAHLSEVRVSIPNFTELTFTVDDESRRMAWSLFIESTTRVSTQPLQGQDGAIRETLTSLYSLFSTTRELLKSGTPSRAAAGGPTVEYLAIRMLNNELRPFLAKWHPALGHYERTQPGQAESGWPGNTACRAELQAVQANLQGYVLGFAALADVRDAEALVDGTL